MTLPRITHAVPLHDRWLRLRFTDGAVFDVDLGPVFRRGGVFRGIDDDAALFAQVRVDPLFGTVVWRARSTSIRTCSTGAASPDRASRWSGAS